MGATHEPALARLVDRVLSARATGGTLDIRGGGTKAFHGPAPEGEPLPTAELAGITAYEPSELVVTARAGTPLAELEAALAERRQHLPFEPPRIDTGGTVGGMVAAGWAGPARAAAGSVRDHVLGAVLLDGHGELLRFGGQVIKNVAGYDVSRLLAGSMGMLGMICEVSLKVLPVAPASATLRFEAPQADAIVQLNRWAGQPLPIDAGAWWSGMLVVRLTGAVAAVRAAAAQLGGDAVEPDLAAAFWRGLRDQRDEFFVSAAKAIDNGAGLWRLSVPSTAPPLALSGEQLVEWGGAQRWLATTTAAAAVRDAAARAGGHAVLWRGGDATARMPAPLDAVQQRLHARLKQAFDPDRVFNRGRLCADL